MSVHDQKFGKICLVVDSYGCLYSIIISDHTYSIIISDHTTYVIEAPTIINYI